MKVIIKVFFIFSLFIMVVSCATTPTAIPEKYNLDNDLETIKQISTFKAITFREVDKQSIILSVDWKDYYLLVLGRPIPSMFVTHRLGIDGTGPSIISGHDRIVVNDHTGTWYYDIDKIYRLKDWEQAEKIKELLLNNEK